MSDSQDNSQEWKEKKLKAEKFIKMKNILKAAVVKSLQNKGLLKKTLH